MMAGHSVKQSPTEVGSYKNSALCVQLLPIKSTESALSVGTPVSPHKAVKLN
jgi:hypothetical protein